MTAREQRPGLSRALQPKDSHDFPEMTMPTLYEAARRALDNLNDLIRDSSDPGAEALGAVWELEQALRNARLDAPADRPAVLTAAERQFLTFALELAADEMASRGDEFTADDEAALAKLRRLADEAQQAGDRP